MHAPSALCRTLTYAAMFQLLLFLCYFVQAWKREVVRKHPRGLPKDLEEGFEVLEAEGGAAWDLACQVRFSVEVQV